MPNLIENLHKNLSADGYQIGSLDEFKKAMSDSTKAANLYRNLSEDGYQLGSQEDFFKNIGNTSMQPVQQQAKPSEPYKPTWQEKMAAGMTLSNAQGAVNRAKEARGIRNIEEYQEKRTKQQPKIGQAANVVKSDRGTYLTEGGGEFTQLSDANVVQGARNEELREKSVDEQLQSALAERDRLNKEMGNIQGQWVDADGRVHYGGRGNDEAIQSLQAAFRQNEDRIKTLTYEKDNAGFWQRLGTGLGDLSSWNPYNAVEDAVALSRAGEKINNGQPLEEADRLLLANTLLSQEAHSKYDQNRSAWFRAAGIADESFKLMPDFIIGMGPMKGIATGIAKGTSKLITKNIGKKAVESLVGKVLTKVAGVGAGTLAAGAALTNTVQTPRLAAETINNMTGNLTLDEHGNYKFEGGDNFLNALLHAEQKLIPEAASEAAGEFLPGVAAGLEKLGLKKAAGAMTRLQGTGWYKNYSRALAGAGFHGAPGEAVEEYLGDIYSAVLGDVSGIVGDENGKGGWGDLDKHVDILLGTATIGALLHAPGAGYHGSQYFRYRHNVNKADKAGQNVVGEGWSDIKAAMDGATNESMSDVVNNIVKNGNLSTDGMEAVINYAVNLQRQRGHALAVMAENKEEKTEPEKASEVIDNSYASGYEADTPEEKQAISQNLTTSTQNLDALGEGFANWVKDESNPPMAVLTYMMAHRDTYTDEQIAAAADYYQSKSAAEGLQQSEADRAELEGKQSVKPLYTTMDRTDGKFNVSSFDESGNLLTQQSFDTEDEAMSYQAEVRMQKQHQDFVDLYNSPRVDKGALADYEREQGWQEGVLSSLLSRDPMELTGTEQAIVDQAMSYMQSVVYPANEVHTEFNQQAGSEAADDANIDTDMPNEEVVSSVVAPYIEAKNNLEALFGSNEELAEEVQLYENMGKSEQEIVQMISNFGKQDVQTVIDFYNAQARFEGFMNRSQEKIEERVKNERARRTFKGTINGAPDTQNLVEITDGTNNYTLVSGDISTDPNGMVTGSESGLILAIDQNGEIVSLSDTSSLNVVPTQTTLDMWEQAYREQSQVNATNAIDPTGALNPNQPIEQGVTVEGEAGAANVTGANEPSTTPTSAAPTSQVTPPAPAGGETTIESVTGEDGVKRYELGVPVDNAIADMQADGLDVNEEADLAISEAQAELDKIKQPKTRAERVKNAQKQKELQGVIDYYNTLKERFAEINTPAEAAPESEEIVNVEPEQSNVTEKVVTSQPSTPTVEEQKQQRIAEAKQKYGELLDDDFAKANDVYELVSMWIGRKRNLAWDDVNGKRGLQKELGWTRKIGGDTKYIETLLAKKGDGVGIDEFVHMVWESPENSVGEEKRWSTEEIKEALLDLIKSAQSKSDVVDYALNTRISNAEKALADLREREADEAADTTNAVPDMTEEEIATMEANLPFARPSDEEETANPRIIELSKAIEEWINTPGTPQISLIDTDQMTSGDWIDLASQIYGGAFIDEETVNEVRDYVLTTGAFYNENGSITIYSDSQTTEDVNNKIQTIIDYANTNQEEGRDNGSDTIVQRTEEATPQEQGPERPAEEPRNDTEGEGHSESVVDEYLKPRNAEEEAIIKKVEDKLKGEIFAQQLEVGSAKKAYDKKLAAESDRATDMFSDDDTRREEGQLFDFDEMPTDRSAEGVNNRAKAERDAWESAKAKLQQLQSPNERNSRVRGALESHRKQTTIGFEEEQPKQEYTPTWQYEFHYDKQTGRVRITRDDVSGPIPIGDGRWHIEANSLAEMRGILENPANNLGEVFKEVEASLHNAEVGEEIRKEASNPVETIKQTASEFKKEQEKKSYGANNKLVSQDRYDELRKRMKAKLLGQLNAGFDPEIISIGAEMAMFHVEAGARKFKDFAERMIEDLGDAIRPYLQGIYESAKRMPGMQDLRKEMDPTDVVDAFDVDNFDKETSNNANVESVSVNDNKQEDNEPQNVVSSQQELTEEEKEARFKFVNAVSTRLSNALDGDEKPFRSIIDLRKLAQACGMEVNPDGKTDVLLQELIEDALVKSARKITQAGWGDPLDRKMYDEICKLYDMQPTISQRNTNRIAMQQYSTPLPMAFVADRFITQDGLVKGNVLEPTAGNGMLVIGINPRNVHANELDKTRLDNLKGQKFKKVTNQDATQPFEGDEQYSAVIANPPFGSAEAKEYDGKMITGLEEQIALNALSKMKDDGKAAIIIGGKTEYATNGAIKNNKAFITYLYDHYNVKAIVDMDGKLYQKQGTTYPTRLILIDGRRSEEERAQTKVYPPTIKNYTKKAMSFDELFDIVEQISNDSRKTNGTEILRTSTGIALSDNNNASGDTNGSGRSEQPRKNESDGRRSDTGRGDRGNQQPAGGQTQGTGGRRSMGVQQSRTPGLFDNQGDSTEPNSQAGATRDGGSSVNNGGNGSADVQRDGTANGGVGLTPSTEPVKPKVEEKRELNTDKLSYRPHNTAFSLESVAPAAMVEAMDNMLTKIEKEHGNIDTFVTRELGYDSIDEMHNALAAEQVDSVAMAIYQMKHGQGMIIGDQTGVGKGRQMAALIRWACKQGKKPIFITQKADLFSDIYRDLVDIGSGELRPFIFNADGAMVDNNGVTVHKPLAAKAQSSIFASGQLPAEYDFAVLTYSQVNTGDQISKDEAKEAAKKKGERYQDKKKKNDKPKATPKATFLRALAKDNYMFLDESHTAAGKSNTGFYFQSIIKTTKAVTFASATFAKRPDTMPMYALRTAMSKAKVKPEELIGIIENGGVTLQEIMSRALTQAGQMVRRERDMSDVKTDWITVDDPETVKKARENYDSTIEAFNAIIDFQKEYVSPYLDNLSHQLADIASSADFRQGTEDFGINNVPFASKTYNYTKQLMLALKVDAIVDEVVKEIEAGRHPVIALENTMGSMLSEYAPGDTIEDTTFAASLLRGLRGVLRYTIKDEDNKEIQRELEPSQLGPIGEAAYHEVEDIIRRSTAGIFISPLDAITEKLQQKGYKVGELTGRNEVAVLDENTGEYKVAKRKDKDKKKLARDFNSGALDVLILNKSASTGISLHASSKFADQRQRSMIIAQPLADINDYMQMIGRIDRTGQVARGYYINLGLPVPAEGRFLMMLSTKLKSLNANTTTSQDNDSNDVEAPDLLNKYGSRVVIEYLRDNPDVYIKMGEPLRQDKAPVHAVDLDNYMPSEDDARKITGYVALLPTAEQEEFYNDVVRRYNELIKYLNDTDSNDLKISVLPLRARTIDKQISSEGADPTGDNPFAGHAYVEWVEMDVLKKPMKAAEVGKVIEQLNPEVDAPKVQAKTASQEKMLNQRMPSRVRQLNDIVEKEYQAKLDKEDARYEEAKAKAEESIKEQTEKINKSKRTDEQKREAIEKFKNDKMQTVEESHNNMVNKIEASRMRIERPLKEYVVGDSYLVPDDLTTDTFFGASPAIFCGFKAKDEGITPSTTLAVFCTLDGRRKIEIKLSEWEPLARIKNHTEQNWDAAHDVTLSNWDSQIPKDSRKHGYIMTGNILQAFADAGSNGRVPGQLVTFTDVDGNVRDGILMQQHWKPSDLKGSTAPIKNRMEEIKNLPKGEHITSADGNVVIERLYYVYKLNVPKSKKTGALFYENKRLLDLVQDNMFFQHRGQFQADVLPEHIEEVVNILSDLGVQVQSENQINFGEDTEMGQAIANGTYTPNNNDPMTAIRNAADSWRKNTNVSENTLSEGAKTNDVSKKDVPLEQRQTKSYTDGEGNYHRGIEEELAELEADITRAGAEDAGSNQESEEGKASSGQLRGLRINDLRKQAAKLRAEVSRRKQKRQELRDKYGIDEKGNISLENLSQMFHDLNSNKVIGKLFDKVVAVLKNLGVEFRFTDALSPNVGGQALSTINVTFYNWDSMLRDLDNQEKARILLHEMIHNVSSQILFRHKDPSIGKLTAAQEKLAKEINDIFNFVKSKNPKRSNGKPFYALDEKQGDEHELLAELANPELREALDKIPYKEGKSVWQRIKDWFRELLGIQNTNTALDSLNNALDGILESYDANENRIYRKQRADWERKVRDAGYTGDYVDFWETEGIGIGKQSIVQDKELIERLDNEPKETGYRTVVQNEDGTFGSPMANKLGGAGKKSKPTSPYKMGQWEQSEENPQLANDKGKIDLIKPDGLGSVGSVDYNPYIHIRENKLNKQFKNAWERKNLVYIEVEYPKSEMSSGYRAEKAAKAVGRHKWPGGDLILSRWDKPIRVVPWEEVADDWEREFKNKGVHFDIVSPHLLPILADRGVKILPPHKNMGEECNKAYEAFKHRNDNDPMRAIIEAAEAFHKQSNVNSGTSPLTYSAKAIYNERLNTAKTLFTEAYQDALVSLKHAQNAIAGDKHIPDSQNAYMAENLMHGKNKNEQDLFNKMFRDPLVDTINKIMSLTGMNWGDIDRYVYTKSGLERNREFFVRDWLESERRKHIGSYEDLRPEEQDIYDTLANRIETDFEDGVIESEEERDKKLAQALQIAHENYLSHVERDWNELKFDRYQDLRAGSITYKKYLDAMTEFIQQNMDFEYVPAEHDYSGFRAMYGDEDGDYDEEDIIFNLEADEAIIDAENVTTLWSRINAATRYGLERYREAGMRSDEQIDETEQMFHFYVPMRGFKNETGEDMYQYFTGRENVKSYVGGLLKHAKGRGSEADYPISTIFAMSYKAISDCNQNMVNQKLYRLCQANPNDLIVLSDSWAVLNEITGEWEEDAPVIPNDASENDVREITKAWEERMRQLANEDKAKKINGKARFDYKPMDKKKQSEHIVDVRINGQPRKIIVTSNPRMAQAINGQLRFENGKNMFSEYNSKVKNLMSAMFTSYSPTFALRNMFRDWTHFRTMLVVREGNGYASAANKYYRETIFKMPSLFKKYREGALDESVEVERDFKDFMDNGGVTGFVQMNKIADIQKQMEKLYNQQKAGKTIRLNNKLWDYTLGAIEALNEGIENNARFATYRASRHFASRTKARSSYDAKEITVNFNRKGAGSKTSGFKSTNARIEDAAKAFGVTSQIVGEGKIFFNATVQAIATTFKCFRNPDGSINKGYVAKWTAMYATPPFMFGLLLPYINGALAAALGGGDDDPYANLAEWTRRKNICIYIGHDNFLTIPVGQELAAFLSLGDIVAGLTYSPNLRPVDKDFADEIVDVASTFSPVDMGTKVTKGGMLSKDWLYEGIGKTFSVATPVISIASNRGWTGRPIYREDIFKSDAFTPEYQMVYSSTNPALVGASRLLHEIGGGDDVIRGQEWSEVNPAIVQYLWEQYTGGPGKVLSNTISIGNDVKEFLKGEDTDFNTRKVEGLKAFIQQGDERTQYYRTLAKYRKYKEDADELTDAINGYKEMAASDPNAVLKLVSITKSKEFARMQVVKEADKALGKLYKAANKAEGEDRKNLRSIYNQNVKTVVEYLDNIGEE